MLANFDHTAIPISRTKIYSSLLGRILGLLIIVLLFLTFLFKLKGIIDKETMYLNSYYANDRTPVNFSNF